MTFFHLANCAALCTVPYFFVYNYSGLAEYSAFWRVVQAAGAYLFTQLVKMLLLATFFPESGDIVIEAAANLNLLNDIMRYSVDLIDLVGLHLVMTRGVTGKGQLRFLVAGLGWASAELIFTRFLPLWFGARGIEFDWKYMRLSFESNINLVMHIVTALLVSVYMRQRDLKQKQMAISSHNKRLAQTFSNPYSTTFNPSIMPISIGFLLFIIYQPLLWSTFTHFGISLWLVLIFKTIISIFIAIVSIHLYYGTVGNGLGFFANMFSRGNADNNDIAGNVNNHVH